MNREGQIILKSILNKNQGGGDFLPKEPVAGILRVDCSKPRTGSADVSEVPNRLTTQVEPPSPQPSVDRLSVTFAEKSDRSESSVKINIFDPGSPPSKVTEMDKIRFRDPAAAANVREDEDENAEEKNEEDGDDDYSVSVSVIMQRRESMKRASSKRKKRRTSSPAPDMDGSFRDFRRRSSEYTNSSGDTAISVDNETTQEQIFENIRLHKEVLSSVKLQPWGMRRKIKLVQQAKAYVKRHEGELQERLAMSKSTKDILARFNIWLIKELRFLKRELANTMTLLIPWELRIKEIESHFGSAVASYFTFLRWMFWVNLVITIVLACFVAIPEMLTADPKTAGERKEMLPEEKETATNLVTLWDFGGILKYSPIFYGYYTNRDGSGTGYRLPLAYFMTGLAVYVYSFVATLRRMAENSRMSKLSEKDDECVFTWKIFTGWDFMIGNAETAHNRVASLVLGFKEVLLEETERKKDEKNWKVICLRVLVSFFVIGLLAFSAYIVFVVVERSTQPEANASWWRQNEITVSVSIISLLFPFFFELLGLLEAYHPRKSLRIQLARIMVLNLLNLYTLIFSQFWKISDMTIELQNLKDNYTLPFSTNTESPGSVCVFIAINCSAEPSLSDASSVTSNPFPTAVFTKLSNVTRTATTSKTFADSYNLTTASNDVNYTDEYYLSKLIDFNLTTLEVFTRRTNVPLHHVVVPDDDSSIEADANSSSNNYNEFSSLSSSSLSSSPSHAFYYLNDFMTESPPSNESFSKVNSSDSEESVDISFYNGTSPSWIESNGNFASGPEDSELEQSTPSGRDFPTASKTTESYDILPNVCFMKKCEGVDDQREEKILRGVYDVEMRKRLRSLCWETMFGQELVKLTVMDLILTILSVFLLDFFRAIFVRLMNNCWCWDLEKKFPQYGDFKIAENILHLVYNQGMVWMGMFFSPGLPAINLIKLVIMMYLRSWAVLTCNVPHEVVFRASRSNNFYLALLLTMLFLCVLPVGFAIVWIEPSWHCGPFSDYKRIYHLFTTTLQKALPKTLHKALDYVASPGIIIPLLTLLVLIIYYLVSLTNSLREANNDLKTQLRRERTEERRKMFQMVNKRARKESKDSEMPFAKWKKLLPELAVRQLAVGTDVEKADKNEVEPSTEAKKEINRKDLLARLMKKALKKSSGTSGDDETRVCPVEESFRDSGGHETPETSTSRKHEQLKINKSVVAILPANIDANDEPTTVTQVSFHRNSQPENIPEIRISKIESDEHLLKDDAESKEKNRFTSVVESFLLSKKQKRNDKGKANEDVCEKETSTSQGMSHIQK